MIPALLALLAPAAMATLTPTLPRGNEIVQRGASEICVIPKKLAGAKYTKKDLENETGLCNMEIHSGANVAVCGKTNSTNPGVEFFRPPTGMSVATLEAQNCEVSKAQDPNDEIKKLAKYKLSTSCSYTPSLLAYYHVSRALGNVNQVPVSVLRTMDLKRHLAIGNKTMALIKKQGKEKDVIGLTWGSLLNFLNQGAAGKKKDVLFTDDFKQSFGALQRNPTKEEKYSEMYNGGANQDIRAKNFRDKNVTYAALKSSSSIANKWSTENVQKLVQMKDVADMIAMDTMLSQEDRFGNVHYTMEYLFIKENKDGKKEVKDESKLTDEEVKSLQAVRVKKMMMKDNDCGVNRTNHLKNNGLLAGLRHFSAETYHKLLALNASLASEETKSFFKRETMMNDSDFSQFKSNVAFTVTTLRDACKTGRLQLDLDLDNQFADGQIKKTCD